MTQAARSARPGVLDEQAGGVVCQLPVVVKAWRGVVVALTRAVVRDPDVALLEALADEDVSAVRTVRDATRQVLTELADGAVPSATATEMLHDASRRAAAHLALGVGR